MSTIAERARAVVADFPTAGGWEERYKHLIQLGRELESLSSEEKIDRFKIEGCVSQVWVVPSREKSRVIFRGDSEAAIVKGILALLVRVYSGSRPQEVVSFQPTFLEELGIHEHLSMNRRNGLSQVLKQIRLYGMVFAAQDQAQDNVASQQAAKEGES